MVINFSLNDNTQKEILKHIETTLIQKATLI